MTIPVYLYLTAVIMGSNSSFDLKKFSQLLNKNFFRSYIYILHKHCNNKCSASHIFLIIVHIFNQYIEITFIHIMIVRTTCTCQTLTGYHDL